MANWLSPYQSGKLIEGVMRILPTKRPLLFSKSFSNVNTTLQPTINLDVEFPVNNIMAEHVDPDVDTTPVTLGNFGTLEMGFSYIKESLGSPDYQELIQRELGETPNLVNQNNALAARYASNIAKKTAEVYRRIENLHEYMSLEILLTGKYEVNSARHKRVKWDFQRNVYTAPAGGNVAVQTDRAVEIMEKELVPEVDLTTLSANGATAGNVGAMAWDAAQKGVSITSARYSSPVHQLIRMLEIAAYQYGTEYIVMSSDAYAWFEKDLSSSAFEKAFDLTKNVDVSREQVKLLVLPKVNEIEGLNFRRMMPDGNGNFVPIYTYNAVYHDRISGVRKPYFPNGHVLLVPSSQYGLVRYGRIMHLDTKWEAMPHWFQYYQNPKTKIEEWIYHSNVFRGHTAINGVISWKVCTEAPKTI